MTLEEKRGRLLGGLDVSNQIMNWVNSQEERFICRKKLMRKLIEVRPKEETWSTEASEKEHK